MALSPNKRKCNDELNFDLVPTKKMLITNGIVENSDIDSVCNTVNDYGNSLNLKADTRNYLEYYIKSDEKEKESNREKK